MKHHDLCVGKKIVETLNCFGIKSEIIGCTNGVTYTLYEIKVAPGTRMLSVASHEEDLAVALSEERVRIVAPIPGKTTIGIDVCAPIRIGIIFDSFDQELEKSFGVIPVALGMDVYGNRHVMDLARCPHLLIAGSLDEQRMCRLYEKFILEYYRKEFPRISVNASQICVH